VAVLVVQDRCIDGGDAWLNISGVCQRDIKTVVHKWLHVAVPVNAQSSVADLIIGTLCRRIKGLVDRVNLAIAAMVRIIPEICTNDRKRAVQACLEARRTDLRRALAHPAVVTVVARIVAGAAIVHILVQVDTAIGTIRHSSVAGFHDDALVAHLGSLDGVSARAAIYATGVFAVAHVLLIKAAVAPDIPGFALLHGGNPSVYEGY